MLFQDRTAAGKVLAGRLARYANRSDVIVLGLPRGGVPVAHEVAKALNAPLDIFLVRKLGVPGHEELAMGAIASGGVKVLNPDIVRSYKLFDAVIHKVTIREQRELERREKLYRGGRSAPELKGCIVILVDDGLATGATMRAAVLALREHHPARIVIAVPVASPDICAEFESQVDEVICADTPRHFFSVGAWYGDFKQVTDDEVRELLSQSANGDRQHTASTC